MEGVLLKESDVIMQRRDFGMEFGTLILAQDSLVFEKKPTILGKKGVVVQIPVAKIIATNATREPTKIEKSLSMVGIPASPPQILKIVMSEAGYELEYFFNVKKPKAWIEKIQEAKKSLPALQGAQNELQ